MANADLNGANLEGANLSNADLGGADLTNANLIGANLTRAFLQVAKLIGANLIGATLIDSSLLVADLSKAELSGATLTNATLRGAKLTDAEMREVDLTSANLISADMTNARLDGADLTDADLRGATLTNAELSKANLTHANLSEADLSYAALVGTDVTSARLNYANLTWAYYSPASPPPDPFVAGIRGLQTVVFADGEEIGLVQLRDLLNRAGLRDLEREATYAIESGRTWYAIDGWKEDPVRAAEGVFRRAAFDLSTAYGLHPARALLLIAGLWALLILVYLWPIHLQPRAPDSAGIYRVWPKDRIETADGRLSVDNPEEVQRLQRGWWASLGWAAYFSLLSAFHIGFREFSVGTWIARIQPRKYSLEPLGWVRVVSGVQSLFSVYLLAMWALTYFGRPFQ
ncbi:MAG: hypothetical protein BroJett029_17860 [Alphaproteobacteria bacterium]|nr:MAG: hypothetical protein BroJett029_17860 [Alphaproteobacteria bacterium]